MSSILRKLEPERLWLHFEKILSIPHCSGNERALGDYVISVAQSSGLEWKRDKVGNVVIRKPASSGKEKSAGIVLQAHLDMVCEKNADKVHDFSKDPIEPEIRDEWVYARGTTLGADNGIGIAACLAVMEDKNLTHGPLEFLFTVDEETGLTGANKLQKGFVTGKMLLNLDSEELGQFTIGCAGGADTEIHLPVNRKKTTAKNLYKIGLQGFRGGHSGLDINQGRGNAIKLLARILAENRETCQFDLVSFEGGSKRNAIPREAWAVVSVDPAQIKSVTAKFKKSFEKIKDEYKPIEVECRLSIDKLSGKKEFPLVRESQQTLLNLLLALPHGVAAMHREIQGLVETSTNLAIVKTDKDGISIICNTRSSQKSALDASRQMIKAAADLASARATLKDGYPGWKPNLASPLLKKMKELHAKTFGHEPEVVAVHAGLECGIIGEKCPGMDMISFGPTLKNPHSPEERVLIGSVKKFFDFLCVCLKELD